VVSSMKRHVMYIHGDKSWDKIIQSWLPVFGSFKLTVPYVCLPVPQISLYHNYLQFMDIEHKIVISHLTRTTHLGTQFKRCIGQVKSQSVE
jgi:hypothetical protein